MRLFGAAVVVAFLLSGCSDGLPGLAILRASSPTQQLELTYTFDGEEVDLDVPSPWRVELPIDGQFEVSVTARPGIQGGEASCSITLDSTADPISATGQAGAFCAIEGELIDGEFTTTTTASALE